MARWPGKNAAGEAGLVDDPYASRGSGRESRRERDPVAQRAPQSGGEDETLVSIQLIAVRIERRRAHVDRIGRGGVEEQVGCHDRSLCVRGIEAYRERNRRLDADRAPKAATAHLTLAI